jgi:uncharacterized protein
MPDHVLSNILRIYNPWWEDPSGSWRRDLPDFQRLVVADILDDIKELPQMISVTGPRRVGKTTALRQIVCRLLDEKKIDPNHLLYFSFDDPEVYGSDELQRIIFDRLIDRSGVKPGDTSSRFFFLDEIQRLPRWELFLKKYYDLKFPIRFIVSGSASSPIFRSSQESLLGRIKDRHLLPFSFKEYCLYRLRENAEFSNILHRYRDLRNLLMANDGPGAVEQITRLEHELEPFEHEINQAVISYCREGGFPEVWQLSDPVRKMEYLMEQQIRKVLYEDLMTITQYRKPENVLRFFVYLLAHPGNELNMANIAGEVGVERRVIEENLPKLIMTDLILRVPKFTHQPLRVRKGNFKCYSVDLALRNAVLKTWHDFTSDPQMMGLYAENLVVQEIYKWPEAIEVAFYRDKGKEVDFIVTYGGNRYLPIEVKHRRKKEHVTGLQHFMKKYNLSFGVKIARDRSARFEDGLLRFPLRYFLLAN